MKIEKYPYSYDNLSMFHSKIAAITIILSYAFLESFFQQNVLAETQKKQTLKSPTIGLTIHYPNQYNLLENKTSARRGSEASYSFKLLQGVGRLDEIQIYTIKSISDFQKDCESYLKTEKAKNDLGEGFCITENYLKTSDYRLLRQALSKQHNFEDKKFRKLGNHSYLISDNISVGTKDQYREYITSVGDLIVVIWAMIYSKDDIETSDQDVSQMQFRKKQRQDRK